MALLTQKHSNQDFFIADIFNQTPFKDDIASMEHPVFVLSMKKDMRMIEYVNGSTTIQIKPSFEGLPNIFDKDFLMYCSSLLMAEVNAGRKPLKTLRVSTRDFLVATNRPISGQSYTMLKTSLDRLTGCTIKTNIKTNKREAIDAFGLIESYSIIESHKVKNRMIRLEVTLSEWFYNSILGREMLSINKKYFLLRKPLERRLYEIARKHCGNQMEFKIGLAKLFDKSGSSGSLRLFRSNLNNRIIKDNHIPDYKYALASNDIVTISRTKTIEADTTPRLEHTTQDMIYNFKRRIKRQTLINAEKIHAESCTDWEMNEIISQFIVFAEKRNDLESADGAFIGFLRKKIQTYKKDSLPC